MSLVLAVLVALPEAAAGKHKRPKVRNSFASFAAPDAFPPGAFPPPVFTCVWKEEEPVHDYHCTPEGAPEPLFRLTEQIPPDPPPDPPPPLDPLPHGLSNGDSYNIDGDPEPDGDIEGWEGFPPLAHPDSATEFTCKGVAPFQGGDYACKFLFFGFTHKFTVAQIVSVTYDDGTQQFFVPCDRGLPCLEVPPPTPNTSITDGPSGTVRAKAASFGFASSRAGSSFQCRLDGGAWHGCSSPSRYSDLSDGGHRFEVRAGDAGNFDATPADREWRVDTTGPRMSLSGRAVRLTRRGFVRFRLRCLAGEQAGPCTGRVTLRSVARVRVSQRRRVTLGRKSFQIAAGRQALVAMRLSRRHRRLVARRGRLRVRASVNAGDQLGNVTVTSRTFMLLPARG